MKVRFTVLTGVLALSLGLLAGCQSSDGGGGDTAGAATPVNPDAPAPTGGLQPTMPGTGGLTVAGQTPGQAPNMPVAPKTPPAGGGVQVAQAPRTSFDNPPPGMPGVTAGGNQTPAPLPGGNLGGPAPGGAGGGAKPAPIKPGKQSKYRPDPFVSFVRLVIERPPAYTLAVPERLAALPKPPPPPTNIPVNEMLPLPPVQRRVAGVLYNGAITAILETGNPPASETRIISPGTKVPSGIPGIPDLTVDSIAMDRLVLRAEDGRTVEVKLSGLSPAVLQAMQGQFNTGGGGMAPGGFGGGGMEGPGSAGSGGGAGAPMK